ASAIRENAECVAACLLRAHGWHAPHAFGVSCGPNLCRAPGTWRGSNAGGCSALHGTGGRWVSLRTALRTAGFDAVGFGIRGETRAELNSHQKDESLGSAEWTPQTRGRLTSTHFPKNRESRET